MGKRLETGQVGRDSKREKGELWESRLEGRSIDYTEQKLYMSTSIWPRVVGEANIYIYKGLHDEMFHLVLHLFLTHVKIFLWPNFLCTQFAQGHLSESTCSPVIVFSRF
jgi:hypothetical protein